MSYLFNYELEISISFTYSRGRRQGAYRPMAAKMKHPGGRADEFHRPDLHESYLYLLY